MLNAHSPLFRGKREGKEMLPTGRDIEYMAEIRRSRRREADHYRHDEVDQEFSAPIEIAGLSGSVRAGSPKTLGRK